MSDEDAGYQHSMKQSGGTLKYSESFFEVPQAARRC
jgi:hypothetical protein